MYKTRYSLILVAVILFFLSNPQLSHSQDSDLEKAKELNKHLIQLYNEGRYAKAISIAKEVLAIMKKALGPEHPDVATSLNNLAELYRVLGEYAKAEPLHKRSLAIREKTLGLKHPAVAISLDNLAKLYYFLGDYAQAEPLYKRSLKIREKVLGPEHPKVATSLNNLAALYYSLGDYSKAEPLYKRSLAITEKALGPEHSSVATSLNNLARLYYSLGDYSKAEPLYKRSLGIREKALGLEHPDVANSLNNLADLYRSLGDYAQAEPLYKRSLKIREKALGPEHPDVATSLNNLAELYRSLYDYAQAEPLYKRSLAIRERTLGLEHPNVAQSLNNLATLYWDLGEYAKVEPLYKRSLKIMRRALGPEHPDVANSLNNLAGLYLDLGEYAKAEPIYERSLAIQEKALGPEHPDVAIILNNLAGLYQNLGDYAKAEPLHKRSIVIQEKALGPEHPDVATSLNSLAKLYYYLGEYAKAERLYKRSLKIRKKALGPRHPNVAQSLNNLAVLYWNLGEYIKAKPLYKRSLKIREKALGPEHPDVATSLNNLASLYDFLGDYNRAEPLYKQSLAIREKALGPEHPDVANSLNNLAGLYATRGDHAKAHTLSMQAQEIDEKLIDQVMGFTSEDRKLKFLATQKRDLEVALGLVFQYLNSSPAARKDALDIWLRRKGVILEAQKRFQEALVYSDNPKSVKTFQELAVVRARLSRLVFSGPQEKSPEAYRKNISELEGQKERLEARLSRLSRAFALKQKVAKTDSVKVAKALPSGSALLEFARIDRFDFKAKAKEKRWYPAHYFAFVLHAGRGDRIGLVDLGEAETIDNAVASFKRDIAHIRVIKAKGVIPSGRKLFDMVFEPLKKELGNVREVIISPDGNLNLIPFEVLQGPDGRFLIEDYTFNYLAAGRDVLGFGEAREKGNKALLMGDPDFDMVTEDKGAALRKLALSDARKGDPTKRSLDMRGFHFTKLPQTRKEVKAIRALLGESRAEIYTGTEALEEVLRQRQSPSILHLATHGFFLSDLNLSDLSEERSKRGMVITQPVSKRKKDKRIKIENPLLRSGIALAGANNALKYSEVNRSDGIVTAEKILGLRLRGTDMVVLSACETGLGEVKTGEGVFGLRRAFTQAGARSLVMSLWSVPDRETRELMVAFYKNIQSGKLDRCQALRQAALRQMKIVKDRYGITNPLYWGAFVFMGEP